MRIGTILIRELQVLSRRVSGYWLRAIFLGLVFLAWIIPFLIFPNEGDLILMSVTIVSMGLFGLGSGLAVSDTISSERRLNTLGLLMLTPLRPIEILFGKLITGVTQFLLCLFAITPFLTIPLLSGGVTWADVLRCCLAIWAMTFLGLSVGLLWSVVFRELKNSSTATSITLLGIHLIPLLTLFIFYEFFDVRLYSNPTYILFPLAGIIEATIGVAFDSSRYFNSIVVLIGTGIGFIIVTYFSFLLVWRWETNPKSAAPNTQSTIPGDKPTKIRSNKNRHLCINDNENSYQKLIAVFHPKHLWYRAIIYLIFIFMMICVLSPFFEDFFRRSEELMFLAIPFLILLELAVRWSVAVETPHQIVHDRKTGIMELLMVSPLSDKSIVSGLITNLREFQFNRLLLSGISYLSFFLSIIFYENYNRSWSTDNSVVRFVIFVCALFWIYWGLRLELKKSSTKCFLLIIITQLSLIGAFILVFVNLNSSYSSNYFTYFYNGTMIFLCLAGVIFLSFFSLRHELKPLNTIKFIFLMIGHLFIIGPLASDFYFYYYNKYPLGVIIILLGFVGGSLYISYCMLQTNRNLLQPRRIALIMIAQLSIAGGFYYLMATALSFNYRQPTGIYFWLTCGTIILLFWGFRSRSKRWRTNRFILFSIGGLSVFLIFSFLLYDWQFVSERNAFLLYSCFLAGSLFLLFYESYTVQSFGLYLAACNLTHFKITSILFTINFIFPFLLLVLIMSVLSIIRFQSLFFNDNSYLFSGIMIWFLMRTAIALILNKISSYQLLNIRQINA